MSLLDTSLIGVVAAELMEALEEQLPDTVQTVSLGTVAIVAELNVVDGDGQEISLVTVKCSDARRWIQAGLLQHAAVGVASEGRM